MLFEDADIAASLERLFENEMAHAPEVVRGRHRPLLSARLPEALCRNGVAWVVGTAQAPVLLPFLAGTEPMFSEHGQMLWRVDARRQAMPSCAGMPSGG